MTEGVLDSIVGIVLVMVVSGIVFGLYLVVQAIRGRLPAGVPEQLGVRVFSRKPKW